MSTQAIEAADQTEPVETTDKQSVWESIKGWSGTVMLGVSIAYVVAMFIVPLLLGASARTIMTGSMAPEMPPGHVIVSQPVDPTTLKVGDVITYMPDNNSTGGIPIVHRVTQVVVVNDFLAAIITKGDANRFEDKPIMPEQITGKVLYTMPYIGYWNLFVHNLKNEAPAPVQWTD